MMTKIKEKLNQTKEWIKKQWKKILVILGIGVALVASQIFLPLGSSNIVKYPTAAVSTLEAPYDDDTWANPTNVYTDNAVYSSITAATFDSPDYSYVLKSTIFGFAIPTGATIDGIVVEIERYNDATELGQDAVVQLTKTGTRVGTNKYAAGTWETTPTIKSYGSSTDLWGTTWTVAEINASTFGLHFVAQANTANADIYVDFIRITVYYTAGATQRRIIITQ